MQAQFTGIHAREEILTRPAYKQETGQTESEYVAGEEFALE